MSQPLTHDEIYAHSAREVATFWARPKDCCPSAWTRLQWNVHGLVAAEVIFARGKVLVRMPWGRYSKGDEVDLFGLIEPPPDVLERARP